jgi:hypothetical protein
VQVAHLRGVVSADCKGSAQLTASSRKLPENQALRSCICCIAALRISTIVHLQHYPIFIATEGANTVPEKIEGLRL